jgi:hypothetical protein
MEPLDHTAYRLLHDPFFYEVEIFTKHFEDVVEPMIERQRLLTDQSAL